MSKDIKMEMTIVMGNKGDVYNMAEKIHNQLAGNKDYVDSNIVLNFDDGDIHLYIMNECENIPEIRI